MHGYKAVHLYGSCVYTVMVEYIAECQRDTYRI